MTITLVNSMVLVPFFTKIFAFHEPTNMTDEQRLLKYVLRNYEKNVRPVRNSNSPVQVALGLTLIHIFDMDEKNQILTTNVWLDQEWSDEFLRWDPRYFGNITSLRIPGDMIWVPDIVLYNNADDYYGRYMPSRAMVHYDGVVFRPIPAKMRSTCRTDVTYFPFDSQHCYMKFGSWTYPGFQLNVTMRKNESIDLTNYVISGEFDLVHTEQMRREVKYTCCPDAFPDVIFFLHMRRKVLFYVYNAVLPCAMLSVLTLLVFWLPPDSGEKITLGVTVLLAFSVFMLNIAERMPETSDSLPLIGIYLIAVMAITSVSVLMTVIVLNFHYRGPLRAKVPRWMEWLFLDKLRRLLRMDFSSKNRLEEASNLSQFNDNYSRKKKDFRVNANTKEPWWLKSEVVTDESSDDSSEDPPNENLLFSNTNTASPILGRNIRSFCRENSDLHEMTPLTGPQNQELLNRRLESQSPSSEHPATWSVAKRAFLSNGKKTISFKEDSQDSLPLGQVKDERGDGPIFEKPPMVDKLSFTNAELITDGMRNQEEPMMRWLMNSQLGRSRPGSQSKRKSPAGITRSKEAVKALNYIRSSISVSKQSENRAMKWRKIAEVIDRLFFWIFLIVTAAITFILLILIPLIRSAVEANTAFNETQYGVSNENALTVSRRA